MAKNVKLAERTQLQLRLDAFAAPNHPMWTSFNTDIFNSQFGVITGTSGTRSLQLNLRLQF